MTSGSAIVGQEERIILALDCSQAEEVYQLLDELGDRIGALKVGAELLASLGVKFVLDELCDAGFKVFYDAKFADIPNSVAKASRAIAPHVWMFNVHAAAGAPSIRAATQNKAGSLVAAVLNLGSLDDGEYWDIFGATRPEKTRQLAGLARSEACDAVICSPTDLAALAEPEHADLLKIVPGVRFAEHDPEDQLHATTPRAAMALGADYLVVGRILTAARSGQRRQAHRRLMDEVQVGLAEREGRDAARSARVDGG